MGTEKVMHYPDGATPLDLGEIEGLKFKHITTREELDHLEQANIESGLILLNRKKDDDILTERFIRELHKMLFGDIWKWAGTFRKTEKNIGINPIHISTQLRLLLDDVRFWIDHKTYSTIEIALRFHHKLVYIHLFPNGNGRHARIMADVLLKSNGHNEIDWAGGFNLQAMNERRNQYIKALRIADGGDYASLLSFAGIKDEYGFRQYK
jgi:Fic-DOC domain mobile mystery protein B